MGSLLLKQFTALRRNKTPNQHPCSLNRKDLSLGLWLRQIRGGFFFPIQMCGQFLNNNNCHSVSSTMLHDLYRGQWQNCFSKLWQFWEWKLIIMRRHWAQTGTALSKGGHMTTLFIIFTLSNNPVSLSSMHIFDEKTKQKKKKPKKETNRTWDRDLLKARMVVSSINPSPSPADNCIVCFNHSKDQRIKNTVRNLVLYRYFHFYFCWLMSLPDLSLLHPLSFPPCSFSLCFSLCVSHTHTHTF